MAKQASRRVSGRMVAFLRAINIGGHVATMEELRKHCLKAGAKDVETFIASGNVIFSWPSDDAAKAERTIEASLQKSLGYEVKTFIRRADELVELARYQAFPEADVKAATVMLVGLMAAPLDAAAAKTLLGFKSDVDDFHTRGREVFWLCKTRQSESPFFRVPFEKRMNTRVTFRNMNTVQRIVKKYGWG
jgi:uncharacterized protein (DUF1697 family)